MNIPQDKLMHLAAGAGIGIVATILFTSTIAGLVAAVAAGAAKEAADKWGPVKGNVEFWDFASTTIGGCVPALITFLNIGTAWY